MADPLQEVLAAESDARARVDAAREALESELRAARVDAKRIKERNEQRTRVAIDHAERKCRAQAEREIDKLQKEFNQQLVLDDASIEKRLDRLARDHVDRLWPE